MQVKSIAIIGTGVIGSSWAAFYASKGFQVKMWDVDADLCQKGHQQAADNSGQNLTGPDKTKQALRLSQRKQPVGHTPIDQVRQNPFHIIPHYQTKARPSYTGELVQQHDEAA